MQNDQYKDMNDSPDKIRSCTMKANELLEVDREYLKQPTQKHKLSMSKDISYRMDAKIKKEQ